MKTLKLSILLIALSLFAGTIYVQAAGFNTFAGGTYTLQTSAGSADTTIRLSSLKDPRNSAPVTMAYMNTDIAYGTLDPQSTRAEIISFTGVTQNSDGSAILTGVTRGLSGAYPFTASSTLRKTHPGQSIFILSDAPQVFNEYTARRSTTTISAVWTFASTSIPQLDGATTSTGNQFVTANGVGLSLSSYLVKATTTAQTVSGPIVFTASTTFTATTTFATSTFNASTTFLGRTYVSTTPTTGTEVANKTYVDGVAISGAANSSITTKGIGAVSVAPASSTFAIFVGDNDGRVPTQAENDALQGATGTPSNTNRYLTQSNLKFGGTGASSTLSCSSGTTTIDLNGAGYFERNYTSISITGTCGVTFSNPHANGTVIKIRSQGNVTMTSSNTSFEVSGLGGLGGNPQGTSGSNLPSTAGRGYLNTGAPLVRGINTSSSGQNGTNVGGFDWTTYVLNGTASYSGSIGATALPVINQYDPIYPGGGGSGSIFNLGSGGAGGRGGGALDIEVGGALNFTGLIWAKGQTGTIGSDSTGGHGAGGSVRILYNTLTSNSGTIVAASATTTGNLGQSLVELNTSK